MSRYTWLLVALLTTSARAEWSYGISEDKMRGVSHKNAVVTSNEEVTLEFPYAGANRAHIVLREATPNQVFLFFDQGQLNCNVDTCRVSAKFDDGPVLPFYGDRAESGVTNLTFLPYDEFVRLIASHKKLTMEATFYRMGTRQFSFDIGDLVWKVPPPRRKAVNPH